MAPRPGFPPPLPAASDARNTESDALGVVNKYYYNTARDSLPLKVPQMRLPPRQNDGFPENRWKKKELEKKHLFSTFFFQIRKFENLKTPKIAFVWSKSAGDANIMFLGLGVMTFMVVDRRYGGGVISR